MNVCVLVVCGPATSIPSLCPGFVHATDRQFTDYSCGDASTEMVRAHASARTLSPTPHLIWSFGEVHMVVASIIGHVVQRGGEREMRVLSLPLRSCCGWHLLLLSLPTGCGVSCACCSVLTAVRMHRGD
jgi:hypothetical protein